MSVVTIENLRDYIKSARLKRAGPVLARVAVWACGLKYVISVPPENRHQDREFSKEKTKQWYGNPLKIRKKKNRHATDAPVLPRDVQLALPQDELNAKTSEDKRPKLEISTDEGV